ncbi:MAG TPA: hypothetical protein V6D22_08670 [Candidatus Obscuribacterales bacterium]
MLWAMKLPGQIGLPPAIALSLVVHTALFILLCLLPWHSGTVQLHEASSIVLVDLQVGKGMIYTHPLIAQRVEDVTETDKDATHRSPARTPRHADKDNAAYDWIDRREINETKPSPVANLQPTPIENGIPKRLDVAPSFQPRKSPTLITAATSIELALKRSVKGMIAVLSGLGSPHDGSPVNASSGDMTAEDRFDLKKLIASWQLRKATPTETSSPEERKAGSVYRARPGEVFGLLAPSGSQKQEGDFMSAIKKGSKLCAKADEARQHHDVIGEQAYLRAAKGFYLQAIAAAPDDHPIPLSNVEMYVAQVCVDMGEYDEALEHAHQCARLRGSEGEQFSRVVAALAQYAAMHEHKDFHPRV